MDTMKKLKILSASAEYDSCNDYANKTIEKPGIYTAKSENGQCVNLLKILQSNACIYDCAYCMNRKSNNVERATFTSDEIVNIAMHYYKKNFISGVFLSSAVVKDANFTMNLLLDSVRKLRQENEFRGYIHLKVIPNADVSLVNLAGKYADRISINMELPTEASLNYLAPEKDQKDIVKKISYISNKITETSELIKKFRGIDKFAPAGQSTQLIVGATPETDFQIMKLTDTLYHRVGLKRVYYSAFSKITKDSRLPDLLEPPYKREARLYQADRLFRYYKFNIKEIFDEQNQNLDLEVDPKAQWALRNLQNFPVEINTASYDELIRIPGIGPRSAMKIINARKERNLDFMLLERLGISLKKAKFFILCNGKKYQGIFINPYIIRQSLVNQSENQNQLKLFDVV